MTGMQSVDATNEDKKIEQIFTFDGKPQNTLHKGINIVRYADGTTQKIVVR